MTTELLNALETRTAQLWLCDVSTHTITSTTCLSAAEYRLAKRLTSGARRRSFEAARDLGKTAVAELVGCTRQTVEILSEDETAVTSRPVAYIGGLPADMTISITHLDHMVAVVVAHGNVRLGIDLSRIQQMHDSFIKMWLSPSESRQVLESADSALTATMNWSAREATFKAMNIEDEFRPRRWSVEFNNQVALCSYQGVTQPVALNFYRIIPDLLLTVAGENVDVAFHSELSKHNPLLFSNRGV